MPYAQTQLLRLFKIEIIPLVAETAAAVLGLKAWVPVDERDPGRPQGSVTEQPGCEHGDQYEE